MQGLRTVIYKVSDINHAKKWYTDVFQTVPYFDEPFYVGFNIEGYELGLQPEGNSPVNAPETVVAYWGVHDIEKECARLLKLGATEHEKPQNGGVKL